MKIAHCFERESGMNKWLGKHYNSYFTNTLITSLHALLMSICSRGGHEVVKDTIIKMEPWCEIHGKGVYMLPVNY